MKSVKNINMIRYLILLVPTIFFIVGTGQVALADSEINYQMKSKVGITFASEEESSESENNQENSLNKNTPSDQNESELDNTIRDKANKFLPSTGEEKTVFWSILGIGICYISVRLYKKKTNK